MPVATLHGLINSHPVTRPPFTAPDVREVDAAGRKTGIPHPTILPVPPQCLVVSPIRAAGLPSITTSGFPEATVNVFGPQQALCIPLSPTRAAGNPFTNTRGLPVMISPTTGCGQAGQPWASASHLAVLLT